MAVKRTARGLSIMFSVYLQALQVQELTGANISKSLSVIKSVNSHLKSYTSTQLSQIYYEGKKLVDQLDIELIETNHAIPLSDEILQEIRLFTPEQVEHFGRHKRKKAAHRAAS